MSDQQTPPKKMVDNTPKRTPEQRERDFELVAKWYMMGWHHLKMTEELNKLHYPNNPISRQQMTKDVRTIVDRWRERAATHVDQRKAEELARVDKLESEYWESWDRSKSERIVLDKSGEEVKITPDGDPRYLQGVERCIELRIKILGLAAPVKTQVELRNMTDDDLIASIKERLAGIGITAGGSQQAPADDSGDEATA